MAEASAVISNVVKVIGNLLIEEGNFLLGVRDQAIQLQEELKRLQGFLKAADAKQNEDETISVWVSQARDFAYEAEDLLECYAFEAESHEGRGIISIIKRCFCLLDECCTRHQVRSGIESLKVKISDLTTSFDRYGIRAIMEGEGGSSSRQQQLRRTHSHVVEEDLVGVESQVEMLTENLTGENYRLVSIWGMGGLGKTTLARQVYQHPNVRRHFEAFSWICVSQQWQTSDLLQGIATEFMPEKRDLIKEWRDEELVRELSEFQQNQKCLVVLDDMWSIDAWNCIKNAFSIRESGSKVLLTTRNREVASHITSTDFLYQPRFLGKEESWELLQKKSQIQRRTQDCDEVHKMENLGKDMVKHCEGLPLAVLVLGGILATKSSLMEWENVHKNVKSYLGKGNNIGKDQGGLQNILTLSYNDLPYQLKPCFLYLSKYLEDFDIETESLYQIWMAEGLIFIKDRIGEESMMEVAERYLEELAKRCMVFLEVKEDVLSILRFKSCRLHDIMRELCLLKAKEENFLQLIDYGLRNGTEPVDFSSFTTRSSRLAMHWDVPSRLRVTCKIDDTQENKKVLKAVVELEGIESVSIDREKGTITVLGDVDPIIVVKQIRKTGNYGVLLSVGPGGHLKNPEEPKNLPDRKEDGRRYVPPRKELIEHLRSFTFSLVGTDKGQIGKTMKFLMHDFKMLRVLSIEGLRLSHEVGIFAVTDRFRLSSAIGKLIHLRYLSLRRSKLMIIPSSICKLKHLQTLDLRCYGNLRIPSSLRKLERLKHLYLPEIYSKFRLDGLQSLEILEGFDNRSIDVKVISTLTNLQSLTAVVRYELEDVEEFINQVNKLVYLRFLSLEIEECDFCSEKGSTVLTKLFSLSRLNHLSIRRGRISKLPKYELCFFPNLFSLELLRTAIEEDPMRTLEKLPNLRSLHLQIDSSVAKEMICHAIGFPKLKFLHLQGLDSLNNWLIEEGAMPNLSRLEIIRCRELKMIPGGLRFITTLKELRIISMPEEFKSRLQVRDDQEGEDFDKVRHVPSIIFSSY